MKRKNVVVLGSTGSIGRSTAAVLRMKDCVMETVTKAQENAGDILAEAKDINEARAAAQEVVDDLPAEDDSADAAVQ